MYVFALWSQCVLLHLVPLVQSQLFEFQPFPCHGHKPLSRESLWSCWGHQPPATCICITLHYPRKSMFQSRHFANADQMSAKILLKNLKKMLLHRVHLLYAFHGFLALHSIQHMHYANIEILAQDSSLRFVHICYIQIYTDTYIMKSHRRCTSKMLGPIQSPHCCEAASWCISYDLLVSKECAWQVQLHFITKDSACHRSDILETGWKNHIYNRRVRSRTSGDW